MDELPDSLSEEQIEESLEYLDEVLEDYERFVNNIGKNRFSAKLMLNYRDELQETLSFLNNYEVDLSEHWTKVMRLDQILRTRKNEVVKEIGRKNFLMEQIRREPPKDYWWWYLDRSTPREKESFWNFLKKPL